jgi:phosphoribosylaminoimidazole-succinocarboxamide synthase
MGSVKDLIILEYPSAEKPGIGQFVFSDRYSVFDWGEMPDHISRKGEAICLATAYFFEKLEALGFKTHYLGLVAEGKVRRLSELKEPVEAMEIKLLRVIRPKLINGKYDYSVYQEVKNNFLIPLEIIYRNSLPAGSSVFKRLKEGSLKLEDIGLDSMPVPGQILEKPIYDVSTKLEVTDRYISWSEAKDICYLSDEELEQMKMIVASVNKLITEEARRIGLFNEDGKIELGFDENRQFVIIDALGTLDECRFTYEGLPVSKEIARLFYRKTEWYKEVETAKSLDRINWKSRVQNPPPPLPREILEAVSQIYQAYTNELTGRQWFDVPPLKDILKKFKE